MGLSRLWRDWRLGFGPRRFCHRLTILYAVDAHETHVEKSSSEPTVHHYLDLLVPALVPESATTS